jgi:hypothetical protein
MILKIKAFIASHPELVKTVKVGLWTTLSALVASLIVPLVSAIKLPPEYVFAGAIINTLAVALKKAIEAKLESSK